MNAVQFPLSRGQVALVDEADLPLVAGYRWTAVTCDGGRTFHATRSYREGRRSVGVLMHRWILGLHGTSHPHVDHINRVGTDNRRSNLRVCTPQENAWNSGPRGGRSSFKGVHWRARNKRWLARLRKDGREWCSYHREEVDAARAYDAMARDLFGEFAYLNLPAAEPVTISAAFRCEGCGCFARGVCYRCDRGAVNP